MTSRSTCERLADLKSAERHMSSRLLTASGLRIYPQSTAQSLVLLAVSPAGDQTKPISMTDASGKRCKESQNMTSQLNLQLRNIKPKLLLAELRAAKAKLTPIPDNEWCTDEFSCPSEKPPQCCAFGHLTRLSIGHDPGDYRDCSDKFAHPLRNVFLNQNNLAACNNEPIWPFTQPTPKARSLAFIDAAIDTLTNGICYESI